MSKVEWKKFYNKMAEIKYGGNYETTNSGRMIVTIIEHNNIHSVILCNGDFINPRALGVRKYHDKNISRLSAIIDKLKKEY